MRKSVVSLLMALLMVLMCLPVTSLAEEPVTITFAYFGAEEEIAIKDEVLAAFEASHPNIKVEGTYAIGMDYPLKLQTWFAANDAPDVLAIALDVMYPFKDLGVYEDLTPYMERDGLLDGNTWDPTLVQAFNHNGEIQAAPYVSKTHALVYNKTMFDAAGLEYPNENWTEEDLLNAARVLTTGDSIENKTYGLYLGWMRWEMLLNLYRDYPVYDTQNMKMNALDNPAFRHSFEMMISMMRDEKIAIDSSSSSTVGGGFETGKFGMALCYSMVDDMSKLIGDNFEWGIAPLPSSTEYGPWSPTVRMDGYCMNKNATKKEAAWELIKYLTTDESAQMISSKLGIPALQSLKDSDAYLKDFNGNTPYDKSVFSKMIGVGHGFDWAGVFVEVNQAVEDQFQLVLYGESDIDTALEEMQTTGEALFSAAKKN
jgi:ABC-type glycerol-3-phosphate transport system substrate-binding protein